MKKEYQRDCLVNDGVTEEQLAIGNEQVLFTAILCFNVNRAYCQGIGDYVQPTWDEAPEEAKDAAINAVIFHLNNPGASPEDAHDEWLQKKYDDGWEYGPVKDPEKREHPCMVSFTELPVAQQAKSHIIRAIVHTMLGGGEA